MRAVSKKRSRELREYGRLRVDFLEARPWCEFPKGCGRPATEIQHLRGRRGHRLNQTDYWAASCHACNQWAETNTGEALRIGWLLRIEEAS